MSRQQQGDQYRYSPGGNGQQYYDDRARGVPNQSANLGGPAPVRPARSTRRPALDNVPGPSGPSRAGPPPSAAGKATVPMTRAGRLAQAIQREEAANTSRPGSSLSHRSVSPVSGDEGDILSEDKASRLEAPSSQKPEPSPLLEKAVAAFSSAGISKARSRGRSYTSDSRTSESKERSGQPPSSAQGQSSGGRTRRGAVGVQGESARVRGLQQQDVPSTPAFKEMERVLAAVASDWPELMPMEDDHAAEQEGDTDDVQGDSFDPVTLALSLVDPDASPERFRSFLQMKEALSRSLKSSIQTHYRAFDASVSAYNGLQANLAAAQKNTTNLRTILEDVREILGKGRTELGVLESRRTELSEMDRILSSIETLKNVPDKLESLMTEKHFLAAAILLVRSLKLINRSEMREIAATADLRSYFVSQENLMLEYLTEELHNHLYLKSFYTEARWKAHTQGQTELPAFLVETAPRSIFDFNATTDGDGGREDRSRLSDANGVTLPKRQTKLNQFLSSLAKRSINKVNIDEGMDESVPLESLLEGNVVGATGDEVLGVFGVARSGSTTSLAANGGITPSASATQGLAIAGAATESDGTASKNAQAFGQSKTSKVNPEQDSFAYIESILESLAYLGKLSFAMDSVLQRGPIEIYNLVEATVAEVDERNDPVRRGSVRIARIGSSPKIMFTGTFPSQDAAAYSLMIRSSITSASFSDESGNSPLAEFNTEILMDFFWTLYSKLDAVLQGFRVLFEVVQRVAMRQDSSGSSNSKDVNLVNKAGNLLYSLNDIWRPIQSEIQALLHDYLIDEKNGTSGARSQIATINDVLRLGRHVREPSKQLFKFTDTDSKSSSRRIKSYEDSLNRSLKTSVPGLVSSLAEGSTAGLTGFSSSAIPSMSDTNSSNSTAGIPNATSNETGSARVVGRTHRMLVPPNAFKTDSLVLPTSRFLERARELLPEGTVREDAYYFANTVPS